MLAPIVLFTYNRLWHTQQVINSLKKNIFAQESELIIYSDGPKSEHDSVSVSKLREYLNSCISGFKSISIIERQENLGLADSIINGVTEVINTYGKAIIVEDDLVTSKFFLEYMNRSLDMYENDEQVISIHGYIYPIKRKLPDSFFIRGADCWGWATWRRGWQLFEKDGQKLLDELRKRGLTREFDFNSSADYTEMLEEQVAGKNNSWAIRWYASAFLKDKLTLYPGKTLVKNIGLDGSGTHCEALMETSSGTNKVLLESRLRLLRLKIRHNRSCYNKMSKYFSGEEESALKKHLSKISGFIFSFGKKLIKLPLFFIPYIIFYILRRLKIRFSDIKRVSVKLKRSGQHSKLNKVKLYLSDERLKYFKKFVNINSGQVNYRKVLLCKNLKTIEGIADFILEDRVVFKGDYKTWDEATSICSGYSSGNILEKCETALLKVKNGKAKYERDSCLFDSIQYSMPLLSSLMYVAAAKEGKLRLIDFGGSLGSSFYQNRKFLENIGDVSWNVVEQPNFVKCGKEKFASEKLQFYYTIDEVLKDKGCELLLLSSVLQYLEKPYDFLSDLFNNWKMEYVIIDRTPFIDSSEDVLTVQTVPPTIYEASYPAWFFSYEKFIKYFSSAYTLVEEFYCDERFTIEGGVDSQSKCLIYRRND